MATGLKPVHLVAGGAVLAAWLLTRISANAQGFGQDIGAAAVNLADGVVSGGVFAVGDLLGVPDTRQPAVKSQGQQEFDSGDWWNASFHLPAGDFVGNVWKSIIK